MAKENTAAENESNKTVSSAAPDNALKDRRKVLMGKWIETTVAILLGITTLLSAWASWIGSLHSGIQSINFTKSNNMASAGTAEYNSSLQLYIADSIVWNTISDYNLELELALDAGDQKKADLLKEKIDVYTSQNASETLAKGLKWMKENGKSNPFEMPGITDIYFGSAQEAIEEAKELLEEGQRDNTKGDSYNLVSVIYSLVLFLLGIIAVMKEMPNKFVVLGIAFVFLVFAFIYMLNIPMPTGFEQMNFFEFKQ